jgi:hypothetical protein
MTYTHYCTAPLEDNGELKTGMYTRGKAADTPELAKQLARPCKANRFAVLRVETQDNYRPYVQNSRPGDRSLIRETVMEIISE